MNIVGKRVAYITLGCKLNFSETSTIKHSLEQEGAVTVGEKDGADIFVINTCSVTDIAEKKGRQMIRKIIHRNPGAYIVVVGCYAQLRAQEIMKIEGVHLVLNARDKFNVAHYLNHLEEQERHEPHSCDIFGVKNFDIAYSYGDRSRCFLKIQDGCDYFCSYCTIPFARGRSRSATIQDVIKAARDVASKGIKEIILTGVNTGDFGRETGETFLDLVRRLDELEEIQRFRISSIEPNLLTDDIIRFVATSRRFMPHFHIPLQSGSNEVLHLMRRRYERELFAEKVQEIKTLIPDAFIGVDVIAGMRGETPRRITSPGSGALDAAGMLAAAGADGRPDRSGHAHPVRFPALQASWKRGYRDGSRSDWKTAGCHGCGMGRRNPINPLKRAIFWL